ncbi:MAG: DUF1048 domain-containing protein [Lachnospiraceae bacterium]|nr:DUF1048 domain-containing protein [Lachnospiraceae bacterium]
MIDTLAMANLLKGEYKEAFTKIDMYGSMGNVDMDIYEDRIMNLYDMFVEAQEEGKPVEKIIGKDIEGFCKAYYNCREEKKWYVDVLKRFCNIMTIIFVYCLLETFWVREDKIDFFEDNINIMPIVVGLIVGFILVGLGKLINKQVTFKKEKVNPAPYSILLLVVFVVGVIFAPLFKDDINISVPLGIITIVSGVITGIYLLVKIIIKIVNRDKIKLAKEEKAQRKEVLDEIEFRAGIKDVADGMVTRYNKKVTKHQKKGKTYTYDEFIQSIRKEMKDEKQYNIVVGAILIIWAGISVVRCFFVAEPIPMIVFTALLIVAEVFIYKWFVKFNKEQTLSYEIILGECEKRDITVDEYVKEME